MLKNRKKANPGGDEAGRVGRQPGESGVAVVWRHSTTFLTGGLFRCPHLPPVFSAQLLFFFLIINLLFIFGCIGSSLLCAAFSSCGERGLLLLRCVGFSLRWLLLIVELGL